MLKTNYFPQSYYEGILSTVSEGYVGKTKYLLEAEKACNEIVEAVLSQNSIFVKDISSHPAIEKLNKALEKQFGFGEVEVVFINTPNANAFTVPPVSFLDAINGMPIFERPDSDNGKFYDKKHSYFLYVEVWCGIISKLELTGEELLAIILHEVGHNFDTTIFRSLAKCQMILLGLTISGIPVSISQEVFKYVLYAKGKISNFFAKAFPNLDKVIQGFDEMLNTLGALLINFKPSDILNANPYANIAGTSSEIFADSFAAYYGYGPALAVSMTKLKNIDDKNIVINSLKRMPFIGIIIDLKNATETVLRMFIDPHPEDMVRIKNNIKKLENDLNDRNLNPKVRKSVERDLKLLKTIYEKAHKIENYEDRNQYITWCFRNLNAALGGHIDLRNTILRALPHSQI